MHLWRFYGVAEETNSQTRRRKQYDTHRVFFLIENQPDQVEAKELIYLYRNAKITQRL